MLIPSMSPDIMRPGPSLSRRVNANSQLDVRNITRDDKLIKKGEC